MRRFLTAKTLLLGAVVALFLSASPVKAEEPPVLRDLQEVKKDDTGLPVEGEFVGVEGLQIRKEAQREAALSYGARGGLARRTFEIRYALKDQEGTLSKVFDFRRLLIRAPSGLLIEPPVIGEAGDALLIDSDGQEAAVADRVYNIYRPARIVSAPREWRTYLERDWGEVTPPPELLRPENADERRDWRGWVAQGWELGYKQADETFQSDLERLVADFTGMVRYRMLLTQGIVSEPFALHEDRGITGTEDGNEMRIGDRALRITGRSQFQTKGFLWIPADRR